MRKKIAVAVLLVAMSGLISMRIVLAQEEWWQCWGSACGSLCTCRVAYEKDPNGCWAKCYMGGSETECTVQDCGPPRV